MTHYAALVIKKRCDSLDAALDPYMEAGLGDIPMRYLEFQEDEDGPLDPETGLRGWWFNPDARWDWYVVGGRWAGALAGEDSIPLSRWGELPARFGTYAVVTPDGGWHSVEESAAPHLWGTEFASRFVEPYADDPDMEAVLVDCHI